MSNSPFLLVPSNHQNPKLSISWTSPALKITVTCENTRQRNLKKWSSKSRMQVVPWPFVNGDLTTKPITYFYKGNCPPSGGLVDPRLNSSPLLLEAASFHDSRYESPFKLSRWSLSICVTVSVLFSMTKTVSKWTKSKINDFSRSYPLFSYRSNFEPVFNIFVNFRNWAPINWVQPVWFARSLSVPPRIVC